MTSRRSAASYLLRFDDICPTMNWKAWAIVEQRLIERRIRPILAVVPDNRDPKLEVCAPRPDFWAEVRRWQSLGWCIGLHGYQHRYTTSCAGIVGINAYSEFAGVPGMKQREMIAAAVRIFRQNGVLPRVWVAPAHSFDQETISALQEHNVKVISDGWFTYPGVDRDGTLWIPQQLWRLKRKARGVWTVCCHINGWKETDAHSFDVQLERYASQVTDFESVIQDYRNRQFGAVDALVFQMRKHCYRVQRRSFQLYRVWGRGTIRGTKRQG